MFTFSVPTTALFGAGKLNELHGQINTPMGAVHGKKALVVISSGKSTRANGYLDRLENELKLAGVEYVVFDKVSANPTKPVVEEGGRFARENGCDFIVALGGGSVMDAAKAHEDGIAAGIPMGRFGRPEEVANVALFLVSDEASYVSGSIYGITGG